MNVTGNSRCDDVGGRSDGGGGDGPGTKNIKTPQTGVT